MNIGDGNRKQTVCRVLFKRFHGQQGDILGNLAEPAEHPGRIQRNSIPTADVIGINVVAGRNQILFQITDALQFSGSPVAQ